MTTHTRTATPRRNQRLHPGSPVAELLPRKRAPRRDRNHRLHRDPPAPNRLRRPTAPRRNALTLFQLGAEKPISGVSRARLPAAYQYAQKAMAKCAQIDECKSWADKAAALASYARQAKDNTLRVLAERIQARAVRRCGELLEAVPSGQGSKNQHRELRVSAVTRQNAGKRKRARILRPSGRASLRGPALPLVIALRAAPPTS